MYGRVLGSLVGETRQGHSQGDLLLVVLAVFGLRLAVSNLLQEQRGRRSPHAARPLAVVAFHSGLRIVLVSWGALAVANILGIDLQRLPLATAPRCEPREPF